MQSWLTTGGQPLDIDAEVAAALTVRLAGRQTRILCDRHRPDLRSVEVQPRIDAPHVGDPLDGGGIAMNLAILGHDAQVCRVARAWDLGDYLRATEALEALGLVNTGRALRLGDLSFEDVFAPPAVAAQLQRRQA